MRDSIKLAACAGLVVAGLATPAFATIENVGGGTWNYNQSGTIDKNDYSDYVHPTKYHSATSICGSNVDKEYGTARNWAYSKAHCGFLDSQAEYWDTYSSS